MEIKLRIERVDDKTVKCFLSNEELEEYDIDYKDFIMRSEKAREVVQDIMEQAEIEVGYKPPQFAFDLQIMMVPDQGMVLTFSEKDPMESMSGEQIIEALKGMKQMLQKAKERIAQGAPQETGKNEKPGEIPQPQEAVFLFESMSDLTDFARVLPANLRVASTLYSLQDGYYLYLRKGAASYKRYSRACVQAMEFAGLYTADEDRMRYIEEHGEMIIAEQALKKLRF